MQFIARLWYNETIMTERKEQLYIQSENINPKICAFTGHRTLGEDFSAEKLYTETENLIKQGVDTFLNGMAIGFDLQAAETVLALKKIYPNIHLIACIPCYHQEKNYSEKDKQRYVEILKQADEKITLSEHYFRGCMQQRDRYMADRADVLIIYQRTEVGGTAFTAKYFYKKYPFKRRIFL